MSEIPAELKYAKSHEWIRAGSDGLMTVGITDFAQQQLGDLVFVELPEQGSVSAGDACAVVESVKAASDIYSPIAGEIVEVNAALSDAPELINSAPYGDGWIYKIKPADNADLDSLLDASAYEAETADD